MGTVVLHAGRPKTGSTSIQRWIERHARWLRGQGVDAVVAEPHGAARGGVRTVRVRRGKARSNELVQRYRAADRPRAMVERLVGDLDRRASENRTVLLTAEQLSGLLSGAVPDTGLAEGLEQLGRAHQVRVAYYVRPQHTAIEAAWKQQGFRRPDTPSTFARRVAKWYSYLRIRERCQVAMPSVSFEVRPFRADLLADGDVVVDFVTTFLGIDPVPSVAKERANTAMPLEAANLLHQLPPSQLAGSRVTRSAWVC